MVATKAKAKPRPKAKGKAVTESLMVRVAPADKKLIRKAAELRHISVSDYVRSVTLTQAKREVEDEGERVIRLSPQGQLAFWNALHEPVMLTEAQKRLGRIARGEL